MSGLKILYEDNHILAIVKEPGILSQSDISGDPDLLTEAKKYIKHKYNKPGEVYLGLLHRLDRSVGGIMVFARTSKAAARLSEQIRNKEFKKFYTALAEGLLNPPTGEMKDYLIKSEEKRRAYAAGPSDKNAKESVLIYEVVRTYRDSAEIRGLYHDHPNDKSLPDSVSEVHIELLTGRFHQIRCQFALRGYPLLGDVKYGSAYRSPDGHIALRASEVRFRHPVSKEEIILCI